MRPCAGCGESFDFCGSCQPGRRYCGAVCSEAARDESVRQARAKYSARDSDEGLKAHRIEEADRRTRRAAERVGDHRCDLESGDLKLPPSTAPHAATEVSDASLVCPVSPPTLGAFEQARPPDEPRPSAPMAGLEWVLVAWPELLAAAQGRQGSEATCPFCGRQGRVAQVVSVDEWRRNLRHGFGWEA